jgi:nucleoid-associated protein YgaU
MSLRALPLLSALALAACGGTPRPVDRVETEALGETLQSSVEVDDTAVDVAAVDATSDAAAPVPPVPPEPSDTVATVDDEILDAVFTLRRGETLAHFARWAELPVEDLALSSSLELDAVHPVGTEVRLAVTSEERAEIERRREAHRVRRVEGFLAGRGGSDGIGFHTVRTGDTAWGIAKGHHGIPVWVLEAYNPSVDLDALRPGQELRLPLLGDTVVDAESR